MTNLYKLQNIIKYMNNIRQPNQSFLKISTLVLSDKQLSDENDNLAAGSQS